MVKIICIIVSILIVLLLTCYAYHRIQLQTEETLFKPLGHIVSVDEHDMSVYIEGDGEKTIVFLTGGGTCSPILDFKSLYSLLSDEYRSVVIEKFGYGFSEVVNRDRDIDSILRDTRAALKQAGVDGPYILCPHSMSGLEALYWANKYPGEVSAIIGLDMAIPTYYEDMNVNMTMLQLTSFAAKIGITRFLPNVAESEAILHGTLSEHEKDVYRAVFYRRTATVTMLAEMAAVKDNAKIVESLGIPDVSIYLFVSNGTGTGFDRDTWRDTARTYAENSDRITINELECPHYVHDYAYDTITKEIKNWLSEM